MPRHGVIVIDYLPMKYILLISLMLSSALLFSQSEKEGNDTDYLSFRWKDVVTKMPADWYGSIDARRVAENVLLCQKDIGGWAKNKAYHHVFTESEKDEFRQSKAAIGATIDNGATTTELRFLAKVYNQLHDERYKKAFVKGMNYIFISQYDNGGWPQFYPVREGKSVAYSGHITYNDNAMVNVMWLLKDLLDEEPEFTTLKLNSISKKLAYAAYSSGVQCILNTQIVVNGQPTVWCAQHNEITLHPANARKYELASFSGSESVGIVQFLMSIDNPSNDIVCSINAAVLWFEKHKVEGIVIKKQLNDKGEKDKVVVADSTAKPLWARFYDLEAEKPFFCDRDGIKKNALSEISYERRNGYRWYTNSPSKILAEQYEWRKKLHN